MLWYGISIIAIVAVAVEWNIYRYKKTDNLRR